MSQSGRENSICKAWACGRPQGVSGLQGGPENSQGSPGSRRVSCCTLRLNLILMVVAGETLHRFRQGSDQSKCDYPRVS